MPPQILLLTPHRQLYNIMPIVSILVSIRHSALSCICGGYINSAFPAHSLQEQLGDHEMAICTSSNQAAKREISVVVSLLLLHFHLKPELFALFFIVTADGVPNIVFCQIHSVFITAKNGKEGSPPPFTLLSSPYGIIVVCQSVGCMLHIK